MYRVPTVWEDLDGNWAENRADGQMEAGVRRPRGTEPPVSQSELSGDAEDREATCLLPMPFSLHRSQYGMLS